MTQMPIDASALIYCFQLSDSLVYEFNSLSCEWCATICTYRGLLIHTVLYTNDYIIDYLESTCNILVVKRHLNLNLFILNN